jgi:hypothetical protein
MQKFVLDKTVVKYLKLQMERFLILMGNLYFIIYLH